MSDTSKWSLAQKHGPYIDFEREIAGFTDSGKSSVDMRLTFVNEGERHAYISFMRCSDAEDAQDIGPNQINVSWQEGLRLLSETETEVPPELLAPTDDLSEDVIKLKADLVQSGWTPSDPFEGSVWEWTRAIGNFEVVLRRSSDNEDAWEAYVTRDGSVYDTPFENEFLGPVVTEAKRLFAECEQEVKTCGDTQRG